MLHRRRLMVAIQEQVSLASFTYFKIGGPARFFVQARNEQELAEALAFAREKDIPFWILGGGSNMLIADEGLPGLVIRMCFDEIKFMRFNLVRVGVGVTMARAVAASTAAGLSGFEWAIGIPGTIGGSVRGNAGCFGSEMKDVVESVEVLQMTNDPLRRSFSEASKLPMTNKIRMSNAECQFQYRESIFKRNPNLIILSAVLQLQKGDPEKSKKFIMQYARERSEKQDIGEKCAGCMFKNVMMPDGAMVPAGKLIDTAGGKGLRAGRAMVSQKHANYFINIGGATAADMLTLASQVKELVKSKYSITLQEEIQILP